MAFSLSDIRNRGSAMVVAVLMTGRGDGFCTVEAAAVMKVGRSGGSLGYSERVGGRCYEPGNNQLPIGPLMASFRDNEAPDYAEGTGTVHGIAVTGLVRRGETPAQALDRLSPEVPDVRAIWATHCETERARIMETMSALEDRAAEGFGTGLPVRFR